MHEFFGTRHCLTSTATKSICERRRSMKTRAIFGTLLLDALFSSPALERLLPSPTQRSTIPCRPTAPSPRAFLAAISSAGTPTHPAPFMVSSTTAQRIRKSTIHWLAAAEPMLSEFPAATLSEPTMIPRMFPMAISITVPPTRRWPSPMLMASPETTSLDFPPRSAASPTVTSMTVRPTRRWTILRPEQPVAPEPSRGGFPAAALSGVS